MNKLTVKTSIAKFGEHMKKGADHISKACSIYSEAVQNDHTAAYEFQKEYPYITQSTWDKMRLIGCGAIEPKILLLSDRLGNKLIKLPRDEQRKIVCEDIEIIKNNKVVEKSITEFTPKNVELVFTKNMKVLTVKQQMEKISKEKSKTVPYTIIGKTLKINRRCFLSLKELKEIVKKMS